MLKSFCRKSAVLFALVFFSLPVFSVSAESDASRSSSYLYDSEGNVISAPQSYVYSNTVTASRIGTAEFGELVDIANDKEGNIYFLDKKNSQITVTDKGFKLIRTIKAFTNGNEADSFKNPSGIAISDKGNIYVADTDNGRVVILDKNGNFIGSIGAPDKKESQYVNQYKPSKVEVDKSDRVYVIAENQTQGIFSFGASGKFMGYVGATKVKPNLAELFFRSFASKSQKKASLQFVPTEYSNIAIDDENFLFCVISAVDGKALSEDIQSRNGTVDPVRRLNQDGTDITIKNGSFPPVGELTFDPYVYGSYAGASNFVDVAACGGGMYSVLDSKRGRVFTYDSQGNLLYIFGGRGDQRGQFNQPCALIYNGDEILVADRSRNNVQVFVPTEYAKLIKSAITEYNTGEYDKEYESWKEIALNFSGSELAYSGMGRYHYNNAEYSKALEYFKMANNRKYYSVAVKKYIAQIGRNVQPFVISGVIVLFIAFKLYGVIKKRRAKAPAMRMRTKLTRLSEELKYSGYIALHPFDGFWDLKHEKRGGAGAATILLAAATLANIVFIRFKAFTFNTFDPEQDSAILKGIEGVTIIVLLWCVANWSMTTLMDGKGTMKDIYCYMCYSLLPVIIMLPIATVVSYVLPIEGAALLNMISTVGIIWMAFLVFCGTSATHNYSFGKTVATIALTVVGMLIILFLFVLTITLIQQIIAFISLISKEISMRT